MKKKVNNQNNLDAKKMKKVSKQEQKKFKGGVSKKIIESSSSPNFLAGVQM